MRETIMTLSGTREEVLAKLRLEYLRGEIKAGRISCGEIAELQGLAKYIEPGDTLLLEWAGVPEFGCMFEHEHGEDCITHN